MVQNIRYADKIMLTNPYMGDDKKIIFPERTELFLVTYRGPLNYRDLTKNYTDKAYCGLTTQLSSFSRWLGGRTKTRSGPDNGSC